MPERAPTEAGEREGETGAKQGAPSGTWIRLAGIVLAIVGVFLLFLAMIIVRGFFSTASDELIGKWEMVDGEGRAQFSSDGTARLTKRTGELYGKWKRLDDGRLKIEGRGSGGPWKEVYEVDIDGDDLTLTKPDDVAAKYKKVAAWKK